MKVSTTIELSEAEVEQAVREYVISQGYKIDNVVLNHEEGGASVTVKSDDPEKKQDSRIWNHSWRDAKCEYCGCSVSNFASTQSCPFFPYEPDGIKRPNLRTRSHVLKLRENSILGGCCDRFTDQQACNCLETAIPD